MFPYHLHVSHLSYPTYSFVFFSKVRLCPYLSGEKDLQTSPFYRHLLRVLPFFSLYSGGFGSDSPILSFLRFDPSFLRDESFTVVDFSTYGVLLY